MKKSCFFLLISFLLITIFQASAQCTIPAGYAQCYQVTRTDDGSTVAGTLSYAITHANLNTGGTYISFNLAATSGGQAVIQLAGVLPNITSKIMIDGTSNPGSIPVVIQGTTSLATGLELTMGSSNSTIKGLVIRTFYSNGIWVHPYLAYISNINILSNIIYGIGPYSGDNCSIRLDQYLQHCNIYGNILGGYRDNFNQIVRDVGTNVVPLKITSETPGGGPTNVFLTDINVGDSTAANSNTFFSGEFSIYISFPGTAGCANKKISTVSIKYNIFNPLYLTLDGRVNPVVLEAACNFNYGKKAPVISKFDVYTKTLIGTSSPGDRVEVYMDVPVIGGNYNSVPYSPTAVKYLGVTRANSLGNWTLPQSSWTDPVTPIKDYDVFSAIADSLNNSSPFTNYMHFACPIMDVTVPSVVCTNSPAFTVTGTPAGGTFSSTPTPPTLSGITTTTITPSSLSAGTIYTITYQFLAPPVGLTSRGCPTSVSKKILVPPPADTLTRVINISAGTSNDAWPIDGSILSSTIGYGTSGIKYLWAPEEQYAYIDDRIQNTNNVLQTRTDGLLKGVPMFNWKNTASNTCYANWRKVNTITQVNSGTGQLENKDILNNYTAALYGYNDQLSTAVASNASYKEVAFDSFEEYATGSAGLNLATLPKSNLTIVTSDPSLNLSQQLSFTYPVTEGTDNTIVIQYPFDYTKLYNKRVGVFGASVENAGLKNIQGYYDVLTSVPGITPGTVKLTLGDFSYTGFWTGKITIPSLISDPANSAKFTVPANANSIVNVFPSGLQRKAHSGQQFFKVTANAEMEQVSMKLTPSRKYVVSAWVSTDDADAFTYATGTTGTDRRIEISFIDATGAVISPVVSTDNMFTPAGLIIEGWQRLEGSVAVPATATRFTLKFITPAGVTTYFDDIRVFPFDGNMQSYVYNTYNYKLVSVLDQNNYATYYYYNEEGALYLVKKETETGVQTLQEVHNHNTEINK